MMSMYAIAVDAKQHGKPDSRFGSIIHNFLSPTHVVQEPPSLPSAQTLG